MDLPFASLSTLLDPIARVGTPEDFVHFGLHVFGRGFGATKAVFVERPGGRIDPSADAVHFVGWRGGSKAQYCGRFRQTDPIRTWLDRPDAGAAVRLTDLVPLPHLHNAPFFRAMMVPNEAGAVLTVAVRHQGQLAGAFSFVRPMSAQDFSPREREAAALLAPALGLAWRLGQAGRADVTLVADGPLAVLSSREREVAQLAVCGHSTKQIARVLGTSPSTVKKQLASAFRKLDVRTRAQLGARVGAQRAPAISACAAIKPDQCD